MWCPNCQADVAAEVTAETQRVRCAACNTEIQVGTPVRTEATTEAARELLKRWANDELADPFGPLPGPRTRPAELSAAADFTSPPIEPPDDEPPIDLAGEPHSDPAGSRTMHRFESAHTAGEESSTVAFGHPNDSSAAIDFTGRRRTPVETDLRQVHQPHLAAGPAPHFDIPAPTTDVDSDEVRSAVEENRGRRTSWVAFWGQMLAYLGVGGVTVGTSLLLWAYFGGPTAYMPTGWLIVTAGQMMLFLGVVTLVSGGMEQTTETVARRIDRLGTRLLRIEQAARDSGLRGPHTPAGEFSEQSAGRRQSAESRQQPI